MKIEGNIFKDGKFWITEIPLLDLATQGISKKNSVEMMTSAIKDLIDGKSFKLLIEDVGASTFILGTDTPEELYSLILIRQRTKAKLSIQQVVDVLGLSSRNSYAKYERAKVKIGINKFLELFRAITKTDIIMKLQS
jgi:hypothetical protein